ncbi:MAG: hypothetical protein R6U78_03900 [Bacteroidales bacterium]
MDGISENFAWHVDQYVYRASYQNELIFMYGNVGGEPKTELWSLDIMNHTYRRGVIPINEGEYVSSLIHDGSEFIYLAVNSKILKVSKKDFTCANLIPENQYDIFAISVSEDDRISFNALRYSDASIVLGEIDPDWGCYNNERRYGSTSYFTGKNKLNTDRKILTIPPLSITVLIILTISPFCCP